MLLVVDITYYNNNYKHGVCGFRDVKNACEMIYDKFQLCIALRKNGVIQSYAADTYKIIRFYCFRIKKKNK